jgi:hypothetical protein
LGDDSTDEAVRFSAVAVGFFGDALHDVDRDRPASSRFEIANFRHGFTVTRCGGSVGRGAMEFVVGALGAAGV